MRIRELPYRTLCNDVTGSLVGKLFGDLIPSRGLRIATNHPLITPEIKASLFLGLYEREEVRLVKQFARTDLDVVDLGSSIGVVACHVGRGLDKGQRLICVEANDTLLEPLRRNILRNAPACNFTVVHAAINYEGTSSLSFTPGATIVQGVVQQDHAGRTSRYCVSPLTLDRIINDFDLKSYLLVSDIEGSEAGMILDDPSLEYCDQLIIELHQATYKGTKYTVETLVQALANKRGFRLSTGLKNVFVFDRLVRGKIRRRG